MFANKAIKLFLLGCIMSVPSIEASGHATKGVRIPSSTMRLLEEDDEPKQDDRWEDNSVDDPSPSREDDPQSSDDFRGRSSISGPGRRECETNQSENEFEFECKAKSESAGIEIEDEITFKVGARRGDFLKITVKHESEIEEETDTTETETEAETKFTIVYDRLIEYRKVGTAADDHYEWEVDEVVSSYSLDAWDSLTPLETDGDLLKFSASMDIATFSFTIAQTDSLDLTTNKMKIDFLLENYPWAETGDTFIALVSHIETERTTEIEQDGQSDFVRDVIIDFREVSRAEGFVPFGEYTWASTAEATVGVTGNETDASAGTPTTISVIASTVQSSQSTGAGQTNEIAFAFTGAGQGANRIYWDPEAGVGYASNYSSAASCVGSFVAIVLAAVGIGLVV